LALFPIEHSREEVMLQTDKAAIQDILERYIEGLKTADVALLKSAFHEHASFFGDFGPDLIQAPIETLYEWVSGELTPGATGAGHRLEIDEIDIAGNVALVRCREVDFMGGDAKEFFTLVKSSDGWKITSKSWADL
jgi:hypothetical protein